MNTKKQQAIIDSAMSWLGTKYHHAACVKRSGSDLGGVDCAQIIKAVFVDVGLIEHFDEGDYPPDWMQHRSEERYLSFVTDRADLVGVPQPGDVALYKVGRCFAHGAIVVDWPLIIHASNRDREVVLADGTQGWLADRAVQFWRAKGLA